METKQRPKKIAIAGDGTPLSVMSPEQLEASKQKLSGNVWYNPSLIFPRYYYLRNVFHGYCQTFLNLISLYRLFEGEWKYQVKFHC